MRHTVTRDDYFAAAYTLLGGGGQGGVKLADLCSTLGVTTGSFYGHFVSFDDFIEQFLQQWDDTTFELIDVTKLGGDPIERMRTLKHAGASLPHDAEGAIRAWARQNPVVARAQERADARRTEMMQRVLEPIVGDVEARKLARTGLTLLAGLHTLHSPVTASDFDAVFDVFEEQILARANAVQA